VARRNVVLDRMHILGQITDNSWSHARASKMVLNPKPAQNSCALSPYPYFCDYIKEWLLWQPVLGKTRAERQKTINRGGLTIQTTLDPKVQEAAREELVKKVPVGNSELIGAAAAVVEPGTGNVLAIAQNTTYAIKKAPGKEAVNWAVDAKYGGSVGFAFGSTAKMFAVAEALRSGRPINSTVVARKADETHAAVFTRADFHSSDDCKIGAGQSWSVRNDEGTRNGTISLTDATAFSVNTAFAVLVSELGACKVRDMMTALGLHQGGTGKPISYNPRTGGSTGPSAITLGSDSVSPLTLASAYATIASGGTYCEPTPVLTITTSDKKTLPLSKSRCRKAVDPEVANGVTQILKTVLTKGTGAGVGGLAGGRPVAGKTGTSDGSNETWFAGYTPQLATAVWVGTPTGKQTRVLRNLKLGGTTYGGQIFGSTIATPIWKAIMDRASVGMPVLQFGTPSSKTQSGDLVPIPDVSGMNVVDAKSALTAAGFTPVTGQTVSSSMGVGSVISTKPSLQALRGSRVTLTISSGYVPPPPVKTPAATTTTAATPKPRATLPVCRPGGPRPCIRRERN
jgi:membrane peptidoglycan carboxypeptidase